MRLIINYRFGTLSRLTEYLVNLIHVTGCSTPPGFYDALSVPILIVRLNRHTLHYAEKRHENSPTQMSLRNSHSVRGVICSQTVTLGVEDSGQMHFKRHFHI